MSLGSRLLTAAMFFASVALTEVALVVFGYGFWWVFTGDAPPVPNWAARLFAGLLLMAVLTGLVGTACDRCGGKA